MVATGNFKMITESVETLIAENDQPDNAPSCNFRVISFIKFMIIFFPIATALSLVMAIVAYYKDQVH